MKPTNVVLIGDAEGRQQMKASLRGRNVTLAGEVSTAHAVQLIPQLAADVIVLDWGAQAVNGVATLPWLAALPDAPPIIVLGANGAPTERRLALELGASRYIAPDAVALMLYPLLEDSVPARPRPLGRAA